MAQEAHGQVEIVPAFQFIVIANAASAAIVTVHEAVICIGAVFVVKETKVHTNKVIRRF